MPKDPMMEMSDKKTLGLDNKNKEKTFDKNELVEVGKLEESFESFLSIIDNKLETVKWKDDIKYIKELRKDLVSIFNEIKETLVEIDDLEQLSQEDIDELILNVSAQTFRLNEIIKNNFIGRLQASDDGFIFDVKEVGEVVKAASGINQEIDKLDLPDYQNEYSFDNLNNFIKESTRPINYGEFVGGAAEKVKNKFVDIQEKILNKLKSKINSEKVKNLIEKLQQSEALPKVAYGVTLLAMGILVANPFKELYGQVNMEIENGNLKMNVNDLEITTTDNIDELNYYHLDREIRGEQIDKIYDLEIQVADVNYSIEDKVAFGNFIDKELDRIIPEISRMAHKVEIDKELMRPNELVLVSSKIVQDNIEYNYQMIEEDDHGNYTEQAKKENEKIDNIPLDKLLMEAKSGVCRQYAAAVEAVSDIIKEKYNSPYLKNVKIEDLPVSINGKVAHAINVVIEKINERKIATSYIDATWDDDGKFNDNLSIKFNEDSRSTESSLISESKDIFNNQDKEKIYSYIIDNYPKYSPETLAARGYLMDYYFKEYLNNNEFIDSSDDITVADKQIIFDKIKKNIIEGPQEILGSKKNIIYNFYLYKQDKFLSNTLSEENFHKRIAAYKEAIDEYGKDCPHLYYSDMGNVYRDYGNYDKAEEYYIKTFGIIENEKVEDRYKYSKVNLALIELSILYLDTNRANEVPEKCLEVLDLNLNNIKSNELRDALINVCMERYLDYSLDYSNEEFVKKNTNKLANIINKVTDNKIKDELIKNLKKVNNKMAVDKK